MTAPREPLLPCTHCHSSNVSIAKRDVEPQGDPWYGKKIERIVECNDCGLTLFDKYWHEGFTDDEAAARAWNTRPAAPSQAGEAREVAEKIVANTPMVNGFTMIEPLIDAITTALSAAERRGVERAAARRRRTN